MNDPKENEKYNPKFKLIIVKISLLLDSNISEFWISKGITQIKLYNMILTLILFLYIIIYNLKTPEKVLLLFKMNSSSLLDLLKKTLKIFKEFDEKAHLNCIELSHFILNLCFDDIKRKVFSSKNEELIKLYQNEIYFAFFEIFPSSNERFYITEKFKNLVKDIIDLKMDTYINNLKGENSEIFCRNISPILLSHPGFDFINFYTYVVNKHIEIIRKNYNNELTSLFRADDFTNDLIKNLIIIFGNDSFMISFYLTLPKEYLSNKEIEYDLDMFENFLHKFLEKLSQSLPFIIRVLLKIIYICIKNINEGENNYNVIYTVLIFNFFISPSTLNLFDISIVKYKSLFQLTRILRNIFFGKEFDSKDKLSYFNTKVKIFHNFINKQFNLILEGIDIQKDKNNINNKIKSILINTENKSNKLTEENTIFLPSFCYQFYWENIKNALGITEK